MGLSILRQRGTHFAAFCFRRISSQDIRYIENGVRLPNYFERFTLPPQKGGCTCRYYCATSGAGGGQKGVQECQATENNKKSSSSFSNGDVKKSLKLKSSSIKSENRVPPLHDPTNLKEVENPFDNTTVLKERPIVFNPHIRKRNLSIEHDKAKEEHLLTDKELELLPKQICNSSISSKRTSYVYRMEDVNEAVKQKWGSVEIKDRERKRRRQRKQRISFAVDPEQVQDFLNDRSTRVICFAIMVNVTSTVIKAYVWMLSASPSMFSEMIHSGADTLNQIFLLAGLFMSKKKADPEHPYGFTIMTNMTSLISGVFIFGVGAGGTGYHAIVDYLNPAPPVDMYWSIWAMVGTLLTEGTSLVYATYMIREKARGRGMPFLEYVKSGRDPNVTVVLGEDFAAVGGVLVAICAMCATHMTQNPIFDTIGAFTISGIIGMISMSLIWSNSKPLIQRSIPEEEKESMMKILEREPCIRSVEDVKVTEFGMIRFKAEIRLDGPEIARRYLANNYKHVRTQLEDPLIHTDEGLNEFMATQTSDLLSVIGTEIDQIEINFKEACKKELNLTVRHVDLEPI